MRRVKQWRAARRPRPMSLGASAVIIPLCVFGGIYVIIAFAGSVAALIKWLGL